jgi:hypothetical protein
LKGAATWLGVRYDELFIGGLVRGLSIRSGIGTLKQNLSGMRG